MRLKRKIKQVLGPVELFTTIHDGGIWQHNWEQLMLTGKAHWLIKDRRNKHRKLSQKRHEEAYFKLFDEYSTASGDDERMYKWRAWMILRLEARALYAAGQLHQINLIEMYTDKINMLMRGGEDVNIIKSRIQVQREYGQPINEKDITVGTYLEYLSVVNDAKRPAPNTKPNG